MNHYPIVIVEDRYGGSYSGGSWLAISEGTKLDPHGKGWSSRADFILSAGPSDSDEAASAFWEYPPSWIAVSNTPQEAVAKLKGQHIEGPTQEREYDVLARRLKETQERLTKVEERLAKLEASIIMQGVFG